MFDEPPSPGLHPGHRSYRLKTHDYAGGGVYFVTVCARDKKTIFGQVEHTRVVLSPIGRAVRAAWVSIPQHFPRVNLHAFVIMPNHFHGIVQLARVASRPHEVFLPGGRAPRVDKGSLGAVIRSFKSAVTRRVRFELAFRSELWQRNYYERVLRDGKEFSDATRYILENPLMWELDVENPERKEMRR